MKSWISLSLSAVVLATFSAGCTVSKENSQAVNHECIEGAGIIGGTSVSKEDLLAKKVVLLIAVSSSKQWICTGTPISDDLILTAAHCVKGADKMAAAFTADLTCASGFKASRDSVAASSFAYDTRFTETRKGIDNDYGLVRLNSSIPSDYKISRVYSGGALSSDKLTMVGYGITGEGKSDSTYLRTKTKSYSRDVEISDSKVYVTQYDGGVCQGDSGGPLFVEVNGELEILGVTSYGTGSSDETVCHGKGIFGHAPDMVPWINSTAPYLK